MQERLQTPQENIVTSLNNANDIGSNAQLLPHRATSAASVAIGTTSPYAPLSIHANNGSTNTTLFAIAPQRERDDDAV